MRYIVKPLVVVAVQLHHQAYMPNDQEAIDVLRTPWIDDKDVGDLDGGQFYCQFLTKSGTHSRQQWPCNPYVVLALMSLQEASTAKESHNARVSHDWRSRSDV